MHPNIRISNRIGDRGGKYIADTAAHTGSYDAILALEATVIASATSSNITGTLTSVPVPAGTILFGRFSSITLTSGKVVAYLADRA